MAITIVNKHTTDEGIYVGRPTALGNPFTVKEHGHGKAINLYSEWLWKQTMSDTPARQALITLVDRYIKEGALTLSCWCEPAPCHAGIIKASINWLIEARNMYRVAVVGSRGWKDQKLVNHVLDQYKGLNMNKNGMMLISGGADGADAMAADYALENVIRIFEIIPDWKQYGRSAGYKRNHEIWNMAHEGVAFWDGHSEGTEHSFQIAKDQNKPLRIIQSWEDV
jgi:hypothetical protein